MKLTPVRLYTVNHIGEGERDQDVGVWATSPEEAVARFLAGDDGLYDRNISVSGETYRIEPDGSPPSADEWVPGQPPLDGNHYLARVNDDKVFPFVVVTRSTKPSMGVYETTAGYHEASGISHYRPTPVRLEAP